MTLSIEVKPFKTFFFLTFSYNFLEKKIGPFKNKMFERHSWLENGDNMRTSIISCNNLLYLSHL